ncbi:hypothetical protein Ssi03_04360 [Sphaerisporangium siamense]|uniref:MarR family transcriptional regulator n=1 Tax=Sphaerisporangium siamense TaxID=795645 RepID=A0A7W7GCY4_9ACTN|nr:MarR family transcriptional regulator [Sphaerisporangium siamense]MBB4703974.1 hypothetical protein [Sphaerisporangium siamense]GII82446.1 hypothetical protein Ssi03_04360 [Sphaerisporangium siamense]
MARHPTQPRHTTATPTTTGPRSAPDGTPDGTARQDGVALLEAVEREAAGLAVQSRRLVEALAARVGLRAADFRCLCALTRHGPLTTRRLAALAGLTTAAAEHAVDRLERHGCALRSGAPGRVLVHPCHPACRTRAEPALRELRESWHPLTHHGADDLALITALLADSRRLSGLVGVMHAQSTAFTM